MEWRQEVKLLIKHWRNKPIELELENDTDLIICYDSDIDALACINAVEHDYGDRLRIQVLHKTTTQLSFLTGDKFEVML